MINHKLCQYIKTIHDKRSFSKAAKELYISQPSLSRYIKNMEENFGIELFDRKRIPLELTTAGEKFLDYIYEFEELERKMRSELIVYSKQYDKRLIIGTLPYLGAYILSEIMPNFVKDCPNIYVDIQEYNGKEIERALANGYIDLFLTNLPPKLRDIKYSTVAKDSLLLVTPRTPDLNRKYDLGENSVNNPIPADFSDLRDETFILLHPWQNMRLMADQVFKDYSFTPRSIKATSSVSNSLNLINCHDGYTFICKSALQYTKTTLPLVYFSVIETELNPAIILAYKEDQENTIIDEFCRCAMLVLTQND